MATVEFLGSIGLAVINIEATTIKELSEILKKIPEIEEWLENSAVAIDDVLASSRDAVIRQHDKVIILPLVCGG